MASDQDTSFASGGLAWISRSARRADTLNSPPGTSSPKIPSGRPEPPDTDKNEKISRPAKVGRAFSFARAVSAKNQARLKEKSISSSRSQRSNELFARLHAGTPTVGVYRLPVFE
jgi:hypothetical protein